MKINIIILLGLVPLFSNFAATLLLKDGQILYNQSASFNNGQLKTSRNETISISKLRALVINSEQKKILDPKHLKRLKVITRDKQLMADRRNRILSKKQTFTFDQNKYWNEVYETIQYINSVHLSEFKLEIEFNSNYEKVIIDALLYSTAAGKVKHFPENSVNIFSRSKNHPQLKVLIITLSHLTSDAVILVKTKKEQFKPSPTLKLNLNCMISDKIPVELSEVTLNISQNYKTLEIESDLSDPTVSLNYNIVKMGDYTSRQWQVLNLLPEAVNKAISLNLTTNKLPVTKQINLFNQKLKAKIKVASNTPYYRDLIKIKDLNLIFKKIKVDFKILDTQPSLKKQNIKQLIATKMGSIEEIMPLVLAALEYNKFKPELYLIQHSNEKVSNQEMVIKVNENLHFLNLLKIRNDSGIGTCYYGYNLGAEIEIPNTNQKNKSLLITLQVNPSMSKADGNLVLTVGRRLTAKEMKDLQKQFPDLKIEVTEAATIIILAHQTQLISEHLITFRIPDLNKFIQEREVKEKVNIEVRLPQNWRVQRLPADKIGQTVYLPSLNGFKIKTYISNGDSVYQTPIIIKRVTTGKRWFE